MKLSLIYLTLLLSPALLCADDWQAKSRTVLAVLDGTQKVGVKEPVEILRDHWGVPHIYAKNSDDLFFAQGWVVAQDRLFQLDYWRRVGQGELAELVGPDALEGDRFARQIRYRGDMAAEWRSYAPDTKAIVTAFTRGINAYIDHVGDKLPIEFQLLKIKPKKWQPEDVLSRMSGIVMSRNFALEVHRAQFVTSLGAEKARLFAPTDPPIAYSGDAELLAKITPKILAGYQSATKAWQLQPVTSASNNWVVAGALSSSGKPMLASDPHRAITLPSLRYLVHLHAPGWNAIGAGEPALPGIALGHNEKIAWGITIVGHDQADIFVETVNPNDPSQYRVGDGWAKFTTVRETFAVKGQAPTTTELHFTRHGPVLHREAGLAFALKWSGSEPGGAAYLGGLSVARAQNKEQFLHALQAWKIPGLNFVYADVSGTIGWVATGAMPVRKGWSGLLPISGAQHDWSGYLSVTDYPQSFNPSQNWLATANHNILPKDYPHQIGYEFSSPYRYRTIARRLAEPRKFSLDDFRSIQHEATSIPGQQLAAQLRRLDFTDPTQKQAAALLAKWDGVLQQESAGAALYAVWLQTLQGEFLQRHFAGPQLEQAKALIGLEVLLAQLERPETHWFGPDPEKGRDLLLRTTFAQAVEKTQKWLGPDQAKWQWGRLHTVTLTHPLAHLVPDGSAWLNRGPFARPGDANTPNNTRHDENFRQVHGASYRQIFDLADWDRGLATSVPGQSGQPESPYYANLLPLWLKGEYFPLYYSRPKIEEQTKHRFKLVP